MKTLCVTTVESAVLETEQALTGPPDEIAPCIWKFPLYIKGIPLYVEGFHCIFKGILVYERVPLYIEGFPCALETEQALTSPAGRDRLRRF